MRWVFRCCVAMALMSCSTPTKETGVKTGKSEQDHGDTRFVFFQRSHNDYKWDKGKAIAPFTGEQLLSLISKARIWPPNGPRPFADPSNSYNPTPSPVAALEVTSKGLTTIYHFTTGGTLVYRSSNFVSAGKERFIVSPDTQERLVSLIDGLRDKRKVPLIK